MLNGKPLICVSSDVKTMESDSRRRITELLFFEYFVELVKKHAERK